MNFHPDPWGGGSNLRSISFIWGFNYPGQDGHQRNRTVLFLFTHEIRIRSNSPGWPSPIDEMERKHIWMHWSLINLQSTYPPLHVTLIVGSNSTNPKVTGNFENLCRCSLQEPHMKVLARRRLVFQVSARSELQGSMIFCISMIGNIGNFSEGIMAAVTSPSYKLLIDMQLNSVWLYNVMCEHKIESKSIQYKSIQYDSREYKIWYILIYSIV